METMGWSPERIEEQLRTFRESGQRQCEMDYSRLLVFVCGNLDEMYEDVATSVDDCDSDADTFHSLTSKLSVTDVKQALNKRFKPEQVARLGNEHVIYPSLSRRAYEQLIERDCARYAFGPKMTSSGAESDLRKATETAARMMRHLGHGSRVSRIDVSDGSEDNICTDVETSNAPIEALLQTQHERSTRLIEENRGALLALVDELMAQGQVTPVRFAALLGLPLGQAEDALDPYAARLATFRVDGAGTVRGAGKAADESAHHVVGCETKAERTHPVAA